MMRDSISPTMLSAGVRNNVIPAEARANLNIRLLPGDTIDVLLADLTKLVNDPQIKFEVQQDAGLAAPPSSLESDFYAMISKVASAQFANAPGAHRRGVCRLPLNQYELSPLENCLHHRTGQRVAAHDRKTAAGRDGCGPTEFLSRNP